ncbi:unnamed protein product [Symbiodinium microadriaticum]|nr:unnamed protein product [Symbiodinium microadriaticum]
MEETTLTKTKYLHRFLADADIRLVRFGFLQALVREGRLWPRRQEAEHETFWCHWRQESLSALVAADDLCVGRDNEIHLRAKGGLFIVSVSHCWEAQQHPDPWGFQLKSLVSRLDAEFGTIHNRIGGHYEILLFVDFICLPQYLRTEPEQECFKCAMNSMHLLYAHEALSVRRLEELTPESMKRFHPSTIDIYSDDTKRLGPQPFEQLILNTTPYEQRGWCVAETQWMATHHMDKYAPMIPERFREREKIFTLAALSIKKVWKAATSAPGGLLQLQAFAMTPDRSCWGDGTVTALREFQAILLSQRPRKPSFRRSLPAAQGSAGPRSTCA